MQSYGILLVDDEPVQRRLEREILEVSNLNCEVEEARNGREALECLRRFPFNQEEPAISFQAGATDFIAKPDTPLELMRSGQSAPAYPYRRTPLRRAGDDARRSTDHPPSCPRKWIGAGAIRC